MATYAIGDIQGCFSALESLVRQFAFNPLTDRLWLVGDLVNRGPASLSVLRYLKGLGQSAVAVLGNHDLHLLAVGSGCSDLRPKDTFHDVLNAPDRDDLLEWLRRQRLLYVEADTVMVHAGLLPQWTVKEADTYAQEVEAVLHSDNYRSFLRALYEDRPSHQWTDRLVGMKRAVAIAKTLTRLRVCTQEGKMDLAFKRAPEQAPTGYLPWFQVPNRRSTDATIVFGHWAALGLHIQDNVLGLDSGCVWGKQLTAVRLEDRKVFQVPCQ
jgi:bis(5'-nucleosyl)-tetraphosphatase (symmetrical)